jgi:hypothetical protein
MKLPPVQRPNGKMYRPRKIVALFFHDADDIEAGVVVFGTHDIPRARRLAMHLADTIGMMAVDPELRWVKSTMRHHDPVFEDGCPDTGRACVWFKGLVDAGIIPDSPRIEGGLSQETQQQSQARG